MLNYLSQQVKYRLKAPVAKLVKLSREWDSEINYLTKRSFKV